MKPVLKHFNNKTKSHICLQGANIKAAIHLHLKYLTCFIYHILVLWQLSEGIGSYSNNSSIVSVFASEAVLYTVQYKPISETNSKGDESIFFSNTTIKLIESY